MREKMRTEIIVNIIVHALTHPDLASGHVPQIGAGQAIEEPGRGFAGQGGGWSC